MPGGGGGQCSNPRGVAVAPHTAPEPGSVYVSDQANKRVNQFTAWGEFVRIFGWEVNQTKVEAAAPEGEQNVCPVDPGDVCKAGSNATGANAAAGRFASPQGVGVDSAGNVYVIDRPNRRVQKFGPEGNFLLMFGGDVNKTKVEAAAPIAQRNRCPVDPGDVCQVGTLGTGNGQFGDWVILGSYVAVDTAGTASAADDEVYVGDDGRIQRFNTTGEYQADLPNPEGVLTGKKVISLATYPSGDLFVAFEGTEDVVKLDSGSGATLCTAAVTTPKAIAADPTGGLYVVDELPTAFENQIIRKFDSEDCEEIEDTEFPFSQGVATGGEGFNATGIAAGVVNEGGGVHVYLSNGVPRNFLAAYGAAVPSYPDPIPPPPSVPPTIRAQFAASVGTTSALLRARINPHFWNDTTYFVEYGTGECASSPGACDKRAPLTDSQLSGEVTGTPVTTSVIVLASLAPDTTYHYRFVAESGGGGPVFGVDPDGEEGPEEADFEDGLEGSFTTFSAPAGASTCPNAAVRGGSSAPLPDCRAYEMVSPLDKNGGDIRALGTQSTSSRLTAYKQSALSGEEVTYSAATAFGDAPSGSYSSQYISTRGAKGWSTHGISATRGTAIFEGRPAIPLGYWDLDNNFEVFTPDLSNAWTRDTNVKPLTADGLPGYVNLYRRDNAADSYEALSNEGPLGFATQYLNDAGEEIPFGKGPGLRFQGYSADLSHMIFISGAALTPDAAPVKAECSSQGSGTLSFRWLRNGVPIPGANTSTYTPTAEDEGTAIQCQVFAIPAGSGTTQIANPAWVVAPAPATLPPEAPSIGLPAPAASAPLNVGSSGQTLSCNAKEDEWLKSPSSFAYQWYRNGVAIAGAAASTYLVTAGNLAAAAVFQCAVTGENDGGAAAVVSAGVASSPPPPSHSLDATASMNNSARSQLYDLHEGDLELVSILPGGEVSPDSSYAGTLGGGENREANVEHAISEDGSRIFWTSNPTDGSGPGKIYARIDGTTTIPVSAGGETLSGTSASRYWNAAADGSAVLFSSGEDLYEFDVDAEATVPIAGQVAGVLGASDDLARIYFVSREALTGEAEAGESNLYLDEGGTVRLVTVLSVDDVATGAEISPVNPKPIYRASRVTPDGQQIAFQALGSLTGYDNVNPEDEKRYTEVYRYDALGDELACVSCNPTGAAPRGIGRILEPYTSTGAPLNEDLGTAARLPSWEHEQYASNLLSEDGKRLFFESYEALVPRDTNGTQDVYQWEEADSAKACEELGATLYVAASGGCLSLISTGTSPQVSEFVDASADGGDVFIATGSSIDPRDEGLIDLYDARVGGGFPIESKKPECIGDACQSVPGPPNDPTPASAGFQGPANPKNAQRPCPQGKRKVERKGKVRCVKKKKRAQRKRGAHHGQRGAAR